MAGDSQASFSQSVRNTIRGTYEYRCVICLAWVNTTQCACVLDVATPGEHQLRNAVKLGVLPEGYKSNAAMNGIVHCPNCHAFFTRNYLVLSLPIPVLQYLEKYVRSTPKAHQKPLHEVFDLLVDALNGIPVELPNPKAIMPYIGLFTLVTIDPTKAAGDNIITPYLPSLSIIRGAKFVVAPANTSATAKNIARIFEPLAINKDTPLNFGMIPISPHDQAFKEKRYWRLPLVPAAAIFAALIAQLQRDLSDCQDIVLANKILSCLLLKRYDTNDVAGGGGPSGGRGGGGGGGSSGGGRGQSKRKNAGGESSASAGKGKKKARNVAGRDEAGDCGKSSDASGEALRSYRVPLIPFWNVDTPPGVRSQPDHHASSRTFGDDTPANSTDANADNSDSGTGGSISAIDPPDEDNPDEWRFGPSFSTNKIIFTARAVNLT